jgi:Tfp pilus assembly protein PilF
MEPAVMQAEQYLGTALRLNPNLAEARTTLAKLAQGRREFDKAEALYREAIQLNPNYSQAYHWYAQLLSNQGRDEEASASMKRAVELDPLSPSLRTSLGSGLSATGDFDAALRELEKAVDIDPLSAPTYDALGSIHARGYGRLDRAIPYLEKASRLDPGRAYLTDHLAQAYLDIGALDQAEAVLRRPSGSVEAGSLAVAYARLYRGDRSGAYELAAKSFAQQPRNREALRLLRDADLASGDARRARERYAQAYPELLENGPPAVESGNLGVATDLALVLLRTDERARALELLDRHDGFVSRTRMIRMGPWGYGIADVQVLMMRGERAAASSALRAAGAAGWRGPYWRYYRDWDPALAAIRQDPDFKAAFAAIERDMTGQRAALAKTRLE